MLAKISHGNLSRYEADLRGNFGCIYVGPAGWSSFLPASGSLSVFAWMREPNVSETHFGGSFTATRKCEKKDGFNNDDDDDDSAKRQRRKLVLKWLHFSETKRSTRLAVWLGAQ